MNLKNACHPKKLSVLSICLSSLRRHLIYLNTRRGSIAFDQTVSHTVTTAWGGGGRVQERYVAIVARERDADPDRRIWMGGGGAGVSYLHGRILFALLREVLRHNSTDQSRSSSKAIITTTTSNTNASAATSTTIDALWSSNRPTDNGRRRQGERRGSLSCLRSNR